MKLDDNNCCGKCHCGTFENIGGGEVRAEYNVLASGLSRLYRADYKAGLRLRRVGCHEPAELPDEMLDIVDQDIGVSIAWQMPEIPKSAGTEGNR